VPSLGVRRPTFHQIGPRGSDSLRCWMVDVQKTQQSSSRGNSSASLLWKAASLEGDGNTKRTWA